MQLDPLIRDYGQFMNELVAALESERTRFYLDTSLLMWLIRLGSAARAEFLGWCHARPLGNVKVPVWAAHELHRHLTGSTIRKNLSDTVSATERKLDEFVQLASERADEELCRQSGYLGRQGYVTEVEQTCAKVKELAKVARNDLQVDGAADHVIAFVNDHMLETDITSVIKSLGQTNEFRYSHLVPPGYHDKKDENRYGDLVIWEEILEDVRITEGAESRHGVLISCDEKTDWVSSAPLVRVGEKPPQKSNKPLAFDVIRPHPLLVHEFVGRTRGGSLYVVHPSFMASALDYGARKGGRSSAVPSWLAAAYRPNLLTRLAGAELGTAAPSAPSPTSPAEKHTVSAASAAPAADRWPSVKELMRLSVSDEARAYLEATPLDQSALVHSWRDQLLSNLMTPEHFGLLLAKLSIRGRSELLTKLPSIVEDLRMQISPIALYGVVLGATAPAFFDAYGEPFRQPRKELGAVALILERDLQLAPAFAALADLLAAAKVQLPYFPGRGRPNVRLTVDSAEASDGLLMLRDIRIGHESVLADELPDVNPRRFCTLLSRERNGGCRGQELRALLAREFLVPVDLLSTNYDKKRFTWLPDAGLLSLDTSSGGGVSATVIDEEDELE